MRRLKQSTLKAVAWPAVAGQRLHKVQKLILNHKIMICKVGESQLQYVVRKTGRKPVQCKCKSCQTQCHAPCLGTPQDILRLIDAGYGDRLTTTEWAAGVIMGCTTHIVRMVQARIDGGWCTFFHDGLCELHDLGLKPTEGRLSHHSIKLENWIPKKSISWNVARLWEEPSCQHIVEKIYNAINSKPIISR
jgi:hypothetical protein